MIEAVSYNVLKIHRSSQQECSTLLATESKVIKYIEKLQESFLITPSHSILQAKRSLCRARSSRSSKHMMDDKLLDSDISLTGPMS